VDKIETQKIWLLVKFSAYSAHHSKRAGTPSPRWGSETLV